MRFGNKQPRLQREAFWIGASMLAAGTVGDLAAKAIARFRARRRREAAQAGLSRKLSSGSRLRGYWRSLDDVRARGYWPKDLVREHKNIEQTIHSDQALK